MDVKPIIIDVDFKRNTMIKEHKIRHGDNVPLMLRVFDDGEAFDLSTMETISLVITRLDRQTIVLLGSVFENQATFNLGGKELAVSGSVQATAQFYTVDGRVSTFNFKIIAESDPITNYIPLKEEETLIVKVLKNGPSVIEAAQTATAGALQAEEIALNAAEETNKSRENLTDSVIGALDTLEQDKAQALLEMAEEKALTNQVKEDTLAVKEEVMDLAKTVVENGDYAKTEGDRAKKEADRLEGTDVSVLDNKITSINNNLTTQLADKAKQSDLVIANNKLKPLRYGELKMPSDFVPVLPCKFFRDNDGVIRHNMNFNKYKGGTKIFVTPTGSDSTGNGSELTPFKTLTKAVATAITGTESKYEIVTSVPIFNRDEIVFNQTITNKTIAIISTVADKTVLTSNNTYVWTSDGTGTYKTTRSGVNTVTDNLNRDLYGLPVPMKKVNTLAECQTTKNSFYIDGASVWVHRLDEVIPTASNTLVGIGVGGVDPKIGQGGVLYFENFIFTAWQSGANSLRVQNLNSVPYGELCMKDCFFVGGSSVSGNGLTTENLKNVFVFNCISAYSQLDGFNYHASSIQQAIRKECFVIEYNCKAYDLGLEMPGAGSNNASTGHESISILRIGTVGYRNTGATIIDINGCYSILYDCQARTPIVNGVEGKGTTYQFSSEDAYRGLGKTYMYNCGALDCDNALVVGSSHVANLSNFKHEGTISGNGVTTWI